MDISCNAGCDSVMYDLPPKSSGKRGRPAKHDRRLSAKGDFDLSDQKIEDYHTGVRHVLTNIFGGRKVLAYVTSTGKAAGSRHLFFSTVLPWQVQVTFYLSADYANFLVYTSCICP